MNTLYMLVGVPGSGKSTWLKSNLKPNSVVLSTDDYIDEYAKNTNRTYSEVINECFKGASEKLALDLEYAIQNQFDIYWDQTNINKKIRAEALKKIPQNYKKIAVVFGVPDENELTKRINSRPGKNIPVYVLRSMIETFTDPSKDEGFDEIIRVKK